MKYIRYFENIEDKPEIGDYVICVDDELDYESTIDKEDFKNFLESSIGVIIDYIKESFDEGAYLVKFEGELPEFIKEPDFPENSLLFLRDEIFIFSKNREDLESIIEANKYNL